MPAQSQGLDQKFSRLGYCSAWQGFRKRGYDATLSPSPDTWARDLEECTDVQITMKNVENTRIQLQSMILQRGVVIVACFSVSYFSLTDLLWQMRRASNTSQRHHPIFFILTYFIAGSITYWYFIDMLGQEMTRWQNLSGVVVTVNRVANNREKGGVLPGGQAETWLPQL